MSVSMLLSFVVARISPMLLNRYSDVAAFEEYCQGETFTPQCRHNQVIVIEQAFYGRLGIGKCIPEGGLGQIGYVQSHLFFLKR